MSRGPWMVVTLHDTHAARRGSISYLRYSRAVTEDYLARIGNLIRDARKHRGWTQQQLADELATSQSAVNRIERGHQNLSLEMIARIGEALDSPIVSIGQGPTHLRVTGPTTLQRLDRGQDLQERRRRPAVRLPAQPRPYDAAPGRPDRGGQPAARGARQHRREVALAQRRERPRDHPAAEPRPERHRRERGPSYPLDHHVPRPAAAPDQRVRAPLRRRLRPRHPHRRAAHDARCGRSACRSRRPRAATTPACSRASTPTRPIVLIERGDTVTENALMAAALSDTTTVIRNASSNYMVQDLCFFLQKLGVHVEGIGTTTLTVTGCTDIEVDVDYAPERGPDRGDVAAGGGDRHRLRDHREAGADRVHGDRARRARGDGLPLPALRGVPRRQRPHPPGRRLHPALPAPLPHRQDPPDAVPRPQHRQPAVLRGDRGHGAGPDDAARLGLREPRDLPDRAEQARRPASP